MGALFGGGVPAPQKVAPAASDVNLVNKEQDRLADDMLRRRQRVAGFASTRLAGRDKETLGR